VKPVLLDLFCGAGGCTKGYQEAGFYVVGVDLKPQPNYCGDTFIRVDALEMAEALAKDRALFCGPGLTVLQPDAIHASPPCQAYSPLNAYNDKSYPDLVDSVRELLIAVGLPYVIENVPQAPLREPTILCGGMFGRRVYRHRGFETSFPLLAPGHPPHTARCVRNGYLPDQDQFMSIHGGKHSKAWQAKAAEVMGTPWMKTIPEVCEALPPAFTRHIGEYLMAHLNRPTEAPFGRRGG
jgi:DNA (cytosine-5)-methyltransferase 1